MDIADDRDQENVHEWIRSTAARQRIYLDRHMRADDLADPAGWSSLLARIEEARSSSRKTPLQISRLDRIRHHSERIKERKQGEQDWSAIIETVAGLVSDGMPPSTRELRDLLLPIIDVVPDMDDPPRGFRLVLREIDRFLAARPLPVETSVHHEPAAVVKEVARLLERQERRPDRRHPPSRAPANSQEIVRARFTTLDRDQGTPGGRDI